MSPRVRVAVAAVYSENEEVFEGDWADVCEALLIAYPWLRSGSWAHDYDLDGIIEELNVSQSLEATIRRSDERAEQRTEDGGNLFIVKAPALSVCPMPQNRSERARGDSRRTDDE